MPNTVTVVVAVTTTNLPSTNAAYASTTLTLTDGAGTVQSASVNGTESPPWTAVFGNVAAGNGAVVAQAVDSAGAAIGASISQGFDETGPVQATYPAPSGLTVTLS